MPKDTTTISVSRSQKKLFEKYKRFEQIKKDKNFFHEEFFQVLLDLYLASNPKLNEKIGREKDGSSSKQE